MTDCFLSLDAGTTSSRAVVFDANGAVLGTAQHEFDQHFPAPGLVEHDAVQIRDTQMRAVEEVLGVAGAPSVCAVGVTNQRETVVVFDRRTGLPVHRALVWQDRRTAATMRDMKGREDAIRAATGLPLDPYFSASKIAWILDHVDGARAAAERGELGAATIDAWLVYCLTGGKVFATEPSNASRTMLFGIESCEWSDDLCEWLRVPRACLPEVRPSAGDFGTVATGRGAGLPITGVVGDQQAALFGHAGTEPGDSKCTYGTGAFWLTNAGPTRPTPSSGLLATVAWQIGDRVDYAIEGLSLIHISEPTRPY